MEEKIDFVIIWVDGNDKKWQEEKRKYEKNDSLTDSRDIRYRDWDNLRYWFRAVEKFAPWVNKIHFVTCDQVPIWLNTNNPKLNLVNHSDYIDKKYLPTFNANPIEINLHRIKGLSDKFVFFNDDMFITRKVNPRLFFYKGKPCDIAVLNAHISYRDIKNHIEVADMDIINDYFHKNEVIKKNFFKWFNVKYGKQLVRTISLMPWNEFPGLLHQHLPNSYLKSTFEEVWKKESKILNEVTEHKFRQSLDLNQWLFENWQICSGNFHPRKANIGKSFSITDDDNENKKVYNAIAKGKYKLICINDMVINSDFEEKKNKLIEAFENLLPEKCGFES